jgi:small subunit ribosomal protein S15e
VAAAGKPERRTFRKFTYRGVDLEALLDMSTDDLVQLLHARGRRKYAEPGGARARASR